MVRAVRPRSRSLAAAALVVAAALTLTACADDADLPAPEESRSPTALGESPDAQPGEGATPGEPGGPTVEETTPSRTDDLVRPSSWPTELVWTPVDGEVEEFTTVPDGSIHLVVVVPADDPAALRPKAFVKRWVAELEETAHAVTTDAGASGGGWEGVVTAQHPERVIETRATRDARGEPLRVQFLLTPLV